LFIYIDPFRYTTVWEYMILLPSVPVHRPLEGVLDNVAIEDMTLSSQM